MGAARRPEGRGRSVAAKRSWSRRPSARVSWSKPGGAASREWAWHMAAGRAATGGGNATQPRALRLGAFSRAAGLY